MAVILSGFQYVDKRIELPYLIFRTYNSPFIFHSKHLPKQHKTGMELYLQISLYEY